MIRVQPDRRFGGLDQVIRISTVVHDSVMHGRAPWILRCPGDSRQMLLRQLDLRSLDERHLCSFWSHRTYLREQAAAQNRDHQYDKCSAHVQTSLTDG